MLGVYGGDLTSLPPLLFVLGNLAAKTKKFRLHNFFIPERSPRIGQTIINRGGNRISIPNSIVFQFHPTSVYIRKK